MAEAWVLTVSQLNEYVRRTLAGDPMLTRVTLRGEISNFKRHSSGHCYFSLKDAQARISCVLFRQYAQECTVPLADGMRVILTGSVGLYARDGQYQLYASQVLSLIHIFMSVCCSCSFRVAPCWYARRSR